MDTKTRLLAVIETVLVFGLFAAGFQALRLVEPLRGWEDSTSGRWPWIAYGALLVFTPAFLAVTRRSFARNGLVAQPLRYQFAIFGAAFLPVFLLGDMLTFGAVREKSGSVAAPALLHGVLNYGPQALLFNLFFI